MVTDIVGVAKFLFDSISGIKKTSLERRERIAKYCEGISLCLNSIISNYDAANHHIQIAKSLNIIPTISLIQFRE